MLAFEVPRRLQAASLYAALALVASGSPDPWTQRDSRAPDLTDDTAFIGK